MRIWAVLVAVVAATLLGGCYGAYGYGYPDYYGSAYSPSVGYGYPSVGYGFGYGSAHYGHGHHHHGGHDHHGGHHHGGHHHGHHGGHHHG